MDKANWIEVSLTVTPEQAEAVAEVIGRFTREGVVIEQAALPDNPLEENLLEDHVRVYGYFFADAGAEDRKRKLEEALWHLGQIQPLPEAQYRLIQDENWMNAWKHQYQPLQIGERLMIIPAWVENKFPERLPILINPGMAFGTGTHPTTQLCLELIEKYLQPNQTMFDIGCGSGILSIAAVRLGAENVIAVDIDPASVASTQENCALNGILDKVVIEQGSADLVLTGHFGLVQAPLVAANILASVIMDMIEDGLSDLVQPGGLLILSGILDYQADGVIQKAGECGLTLLEKRSIEDWVALCLKKA
ncbi:MAG: 50S ribosomal protein L11 methyltransferase [Anaerolineae bacterium]|nr:50S ribosomal protein L11 methyltransferase [Anaerolineae bacterium]